MRPNTARYTTNLKCAFIALVILAGGVPTAAMASAVAYVVDPVQSSLAIVLQLTGFAPQYTSYSGTIVADNTGGMLTFNGGSSIVADVNPSAPFAPTSSVAGAVDNYGFADSNLGSNPTYDVHAAYRNFAFDIASGSVMDGSAATSLQTGLLDGFVNISDIFTSTFGNGTATATGDFAASNASASALAGSGSIGLTQSGGIETLTIPFDTVDFVVPYSQGLVTVVGDPLLAFANLSSYYSATFSPYLTISFTGELVATRNLPPPSVPIPAAGWLFGSGLIEMLAMSLGKDAV